MLLDAKLTAQKKIEQRIRAPIHRSTHAWLLQVAMSVGSDYDRVFSCFVVSNSLGKPGKQCDVACHRSPTYHYYMTFLIWSLLDTEIAPLS